MDAVRAHACARSGRLGEPLASSPVCDNGGGVGWQRGEERGRKKGRGPTRQREERGWRVGSGAVEREREGAM